MSYAFVTAGTVTFIAVLLVVSASVMESVNSNSNWDSMYWSKTAFQDNIPYLLDNPAALQEWLVRIQNQGFEIGDFQSDIVRESLVQANTLIKRKPIFVLSPDLKLLAAVPADDSALGKPFSRSTSGISLERILEAAMVGDKNYRAQSNAYADGSYVVAFPLRKSEDEPVVAIVIYFVKPLTLVAPANIDIYQVFILFTAVAMLVVSLPVGGVFGWLVSRGLRKRLINLAGAAQAWSKGDFSAAPRDKSGDEIGELTRALNRMAEQLQSHIQTRNELARVEERNRLARDLHDTVKQQTYAARMQLSAARNLVESQPQSAIEHIEAALQLNRETQQELKLIIDELRPAALEGRGLALALSETAARWQEHTGIKVDTSISGERPLPLETEQALYRVAQESLSNIARHAEADLVMLKLTMGTNHVSLSIEDNGCGFDLAQVPPNSSGLAGMKQRLGEAGGTLTVESQPAVGTKIIAEIYFQGEK